MPTWSEVIAVVTHPNFIQGGGVLVALAQIIVLVYLIKVLVSLIHTFANQVDGISKDAGERLERASGLCSSALKDSAEAKTKLAESLAIHSSTILRLSDTVERKL